MNRTVDLPEARFVLTALLTWLAAALICALAGAFAISAAEVSARTVGYISSALSFAAALAAGARAMRERRKNAAITGIISGVAITTLALTLGFITAGEKISADGVLSVVTFTLSGALSGSVFLGMRHCRRGGERRRRKGT